MQAVSWPAGGCTGSSASAFHATAVLSGNIGVLLHGPSGAGKSMLAAALIDGGATLIADDRVYLTPRSGRLVARAPAATAGLMELRGHGIVAQPFEPVAIIRLFADLVDADQVERMPATEAMKITVAGIVLARQPVPAPGRSGAFEPALILIRQAVAALRDHKSLHLPQVSP